MAGNGLFRFLHPDDVAVLVLYHGAQAVLAPQFVFHYPLDAAFADGIADAVAGGILHRIGAAVLLEPVVLLGADGAGNAQHMGGQIAEDVSGEISFVQSMGWLLGGTGSGSVNCRAWIFSR